jgi:dolichol-phosphate mannosyltransferase
MTEESIPSISISIPVYNEVESLPALIRDLKAVLVSMKQSVEILMVDDASTDESWAIITKTVSEDRRFRGLRHASRLGETAAIWMGLLKSRGEILMTLASDGQNDPADIPRFLEALTPGVDVVCGVRQNRKEGLIRTTASKLANGFRQFLLGSKLNDSGCGFRAMRRSCLHRLPWYRGMHRFMGDALAFHGFKVIEIPIFDRPRKAGQTKYGVLARLSVVWLDVLAVRWMKSRRLPVSAVEEING